VIERHIVRGIERIFSPVVVNGLTEPQAKAIAMEPAATRRQKISGGTNCEVGRWAEYLKRGYKKYLDGCGRIYNDLDIIIVSLFRRLALRHPLPS
jgi:hypothetical protein